MSDPCQTCNGDPVYHGLGCPVCCASPRSDTASSALEEACRVLTQAFPGVDLGDVSDVLAALPAGVLRRLADAADDMVDPQPDTAPEGPWTVEHNTDQTMLDLGGGLVRPLTDLPDDDR